MDRKQTAQSFASDLRKLGLKHVFIPISVAFVAFTAAVVLFYWFLLQFSATRQCDNTSERLSTLVQAYMDQVSLQVQDPALEGVLEDMSGANTFSSDTYEFINSQPVSARFFLFDGQGRCVIASSRLQTDYSLSDDSNFSGFMRSMQVNPSEAMLKLNSLGGIRTSAMVLSIGRAIVREGNVVGYLVFELNPQEILDYVSTSSIGDIVVTNAFYTSLLQSRYSYIDSYSKLDTEYRHDTGLSTCYGQEFFIASRFLSEIGIRVFVLVNLDSLLQVLFFLALIFVILLGLVIIAITRAYSRLVKAQASSIDSLLDNIGKMKDEGFLAPLEPVDSEFKSLEVSYNALVQMIRELMDAKEQEMLMRKDAEIKQLESQFNTHFIFNTLEIIRCYVKEDSAKANRMILDFSSLLRYSIDASKQFVKLQDDLHYIDNYLSLNKMRLGEDLEYTISATQEAQCVVIPKLTIQPLVENCLKYARADGVLKVSIDARMCGGVLQISVKDNGKGIGESLLQEIRDTLEQKSTPARFYGLYNVHRRLRLEYGPHSGLTLHSSGTGAEVVMSISMEVRHAENADR